MWKVNERVAKLEGNHKSITTTFSRPIRPSDVFSYFHTNYHTSGVVFGPCRRKKIGKVKAKKRWRRNLANPFHIFPHPWIMFVKWKSFSTWSYVQRYPKWTRRTFKCKTSGISIRICLEMLRCKFMEIVNQKQSLQDLVAIKATKPIIYIYFRKNFFSEKVSIVYASFHAKTCNSRSCDESRKIFKL